LSNEPKKGVNKFSLTDSFAAETTLAGEYRDTKLPGFKLKVTAAGNKIWLVENSLRGSSKSAITLTIGRHPVVNSKDARKTASHLLDLLRQGIDPRLQEKKRNKQQSEEWASEQQLQELSLHHVLNDYLSRKNLKPSTVENYSIVANAYLSDWMQRPLSEITKTDVEKRFKEITERKIGKGKGGPGAANNTMRVFRAVIKFAQDMYEKPDGSPVIMQNPVKRLNQLKSWNRLKRRQTMLSDMDLPLWYQALGTLEDKAMADYFFFVLMTGLRKNEAAQLKWDDVHVKRGYFEVVDAKNKLEFALPITRVLSEVFERRKKVRKVDNPYVFAATGKNGYFDLREKHFNLIADKTKTPFSLHDLRRTYLTQGFLSGHDLEMLKKLANHKNTDSDDVTKGYLIVQVADIKEPMTIVQDRLLELMNRKTKRSIDVAS
jgi:integrase